MGDDTLRWKSNVAVVPVAMAYIWAMEDRELEIANLRVRISMLQRVEQQWMTVLGDDSKGADDRNDARKELRKVINEILSHTHAIRKLESERRK